MSSVTLTSLAMLKVNIDHGGDYLEYLRPFVLEVLCDQDLEQVTDSTIRDRIRDDFGLELPERAVQIVLRRLSRQRLLVREYGLYQITGDLPNPGIAMQKAAAHRRIQSVVGGLKEYSKRTVRPIQSDDEAVSAICAFLAEFNVECIRAYLRGTAIPKIEKHDDTLIVLVSKYVLEIQESANERFEDFLVVVKGHMLANALLCPDLQPARTYKRVTFYLDTPLLVRRLGQEGQAKQAAVENLIRLLRKLGGAVAAFSHSREELESVIRGAANFVDSPEGRGDIVMEARSSGVTKSDLLLAAGQIDEELKNANIEVRPTPRYVKKFQIDESAFEHALDDEVSYFNPLAKEKDINSVRSIYVLRSGRSPRSIEKTRAVLVTSNAAFARAAFEYGKEFTESREVSTVITDFSLANMAWLKAPLGASTLPMSEVIAFAYAALQPSNRLLDKYLDEVDKLKKLGTITERDHQLLRSSYFAQEELMNLTLGERGALTAQTITETLSRVTSEIKKEESEKYKAEKSAHRETLRELNAERAERTKVAERIYWRSARRARFFSWVIAALVGLTLVGGAVAGGLGLTSSNPIISVILFWLPVLLAAAALINVLTGSTVRKLREKLERRLLKQILRREATQTGIELNEPNGSSF